mmetsp:Transcript_10201/g.25472  ORF Transcript_10201/g.25472 Transcript_10201/m.25472 type:complete len:256 (-) Transcript_10201:189-956(-)
MADTTHCHCTQEQRTRTDFMNSNLKDLPPVMLVSLNEEQRRLCISIYYRCSILGLLPQRRRVAFKLPEHVLGELLLGAGEGLAQRLVREVPKAVVLSSHGHPARDLLRVRLEYDAPINDLIHRNQNEVEVLQHAPLVHGRPKQDLGGLCQRLQDLRQHDLVLVDAGHDVEVNVADELVHHYEVVEHDDLRFASRVRAGGLGEERALEVALLLDARRPVLGVVLYSDALPLVIEHNHGFHLGHTALGFRHPFTFFH